MAPPRDRKKRHSAVDWIPKPRRLPILSPDIEIGPHGRAVVDTSNGVDEVYFLSCHPRSMAGPLLGDIFNNDKEIDDYVYQFKCARSQALSRMEYRQKDSSAKSVATPSPLDDSFSDKQDEGDEVDDIFDSQARVWRTVLKRRERAAIQQTTAALTYLLSSSGAWQTHLLVNATIRKIIRSLEASLFILRDSRHTPKGQHPEITCAHPNCSLPARSISNACRAYISLESVAPDSVPSLFTTPGIQVNDDVYIPIYMRPSRDGTNSSGEQKKPDYSAPPSPSLAPTSTEILQGGDGPEHGSTEDHMNNDAIATDTAIKVHASLCIPCLRDLYAGAVAPALPPSTTMPSPQPSGVDDSTASTTTTDADEEDDTSTIMGSTATTAINVNDKETHQHQPHRPSTFHTQRLAANNSAWHTPTSPCWTAVNLEQSNGQLLPDNPYVSPDAAIPQLDGGGGGGGGKGGSGKGSDLTSATASSGTGCVIMRGGGGGTNEEKGDGNSGYWQSVVA